MPGVKVSTTARVGASTVAEAGASTFFVCGLTERGDVAAPVLIRSMPEYTRLLGQRVTYGAVYDALDAFFAEGGAQAYVARAVGPAATVGTLTLKDRSAAPGVNTLRVDAKNPGAWSSQLAVQVDDGAVANTFKVTILLNGIAVEAYQNLTDPATAAALITANSAYVIVTNLASVTAAPGNNPAVVVASALTAGSDDRGSVTASTVTATAALFAADLGPGAIAAPSYPASAVAAALAAHGAGNNRIVLVAPPAGSNAAQAAAAAAALRGSANSEYVGLFYPWVKVSDGAGGTRTISPEGYVAGVRARTQIATGDPGQPPCSAFAVTRHVLGLETVLDKATADSLNDDSNVSCIRSIGGAIQLYGWRSLSADAANWQMLDARDVGNYIGGLGYAILTPFTFRNIDSRGHLYADVHTALDGLLRPMAERGTLFGKSDGNGQPIDPGYVIDTGPDVNTVDTLLRNQLVVAVGYRPSSDAELILLNISRVTVAQAL